MMFIQAPKIIGGHLAPLNKPSLVHAYISVVNTATALNCWKIGTKDLADFGDGKAVLISGTSGRKMKPARQMGKEIMPSTMKSLVASVSLALITTFVYCGHEVTTEHGGNSTTRVENTRSLRKLIFTVPRANDILHARIES
ncbi:hypothetical protein KCU99_g224, partial [Aureobasidium melanogenum]